MANRTPKSKKRTKKISKQSLIPKSASTGSTQGTKKPVRAQELFANTKYKRYFWALVAVLTVLSMWLSTKNGINGDDVFQNYYADHVLDFYTSLGKDTAVLSHPRSPIDIYGGLYEILTAIPNKALGYTQDDKAYHDIRHILNSLFGILAMLFAALIVARKIGWNWGILCFVLLWLSPRFLGHSLMNPKDIPFAAGYMVSIYFMLAIVEHLPNPPRKQVLGFILGFALAFGVRVGALILVAYLGLLMLIDLFSRYRHTKLNLSKALLSYIKLGLLLVVPGFLIGILFWPYGLKSPIANTIGALEEFSKLSTSIRTLFAGSNIMSDSVPWYYLPDYIWRSVPVFTLAGLLILPYTLYWMYKNKSYRLFLLGLLLAAFFPIIYIIIKDASLYDGWRHVSFVYPPMVVLSVFGFYVIYQKYRVQSKVVYGLGVLLLLSMIEPAYFIAKNYNYPYTYFNGISGGLSSAFGNYETDYYGLSVRQGFEWMEEQGLLRSTNGKPVRIATTFIYHLQKLVGEKYKDSVKPIYTRYYDRYNHEWDYALYPSRFIKASHLKQGKWPTSKTIHLIKANNTPILAIVKNNNQYAYLGHQAVKKRDWVEAIKQLKLEVAEAPDNESAWYDLAVCYINTNQVNKAQQMLDKLFEIDKNHLAGRNLQAILWLNQGKQNEAEREFLRLIEIQKNYGMAYFYLSRIYAAKKDYANAIKYGTNAINYMSKYKPAFANLANIYRQAGQEAKAKQVEAVMPK